MLDLSYPESKTRRGRVIDDGDTCPTLSTSCEVGVVIIEDSHRYMGGVRVCKDICPTLRAERFGLKVMQVAQLYGTDKEPNPQAGRIYSQDGISPCLDSMRGGAEAAEDHCQAMSYSRPVKQKTERQKVQRR